MANENCILNPFRNKNGFGKVAYNRLKEFIPEKATVGKFTNVVRNLGVDDTRMMNLRDADGKRFFGKNIKDIEDLDFSKSETIPQDTVVRHGDRYFVSNKPTSQAPSKWQMDSMSGRVVPNDDWDMVGTNVTGMRRYTRDENTGHWRPAKEGESGSFLNVQNPAKGNIDDNRIISENIDAIEIDGQYKLMDETSQVVNPNRITEKPARASGVKSTTTEAPTPREIAEKLKQNGVPSQVAGAIAGGVTGAMIDEDGEFAGSFWGGAMGLMLGTPKVRGKISAVYDRTVDGAGKDAYDEITKSLSRQATQKEKIEWAKNHGWQGDPTDTKALDEFIEIQREVNNLKKQGDPEWYQKFFKLFIESGESFIGNLGKTGQKLVRVLEDFQAGPSKMYIEFASEQIQNFGTQNVKEKFKNAQLNFVRRSLPNSTDDEALQVFGSLVDNLISKGKIRLNDNGAIEIADESALTAVERELLADENATKVLTTIKKFYDKQGERALDALGRFKKITKNGEEIVVLSGELGRQLNRIGDIRMKDFMREFIKSGKRWSQFKNSLSDNFDDLVHKAENGEWGQGGNAQIFNNIKALADDKVRFEELKGKYVPQKWSRPKEKMAREKWEQRNKPRLDKLRNEVSEQGGDPKRAVKDAWEREKASRILANNNEKWRQLTLDETLNSVGRKYYSNLDKAKKGLEQALDGMSNETLRNIVRMDLENTNWRRYVKQDGDSYYLTTPKALRDEFDQSIFKEANEKLVETSEHVLATYNLAKFANFFDRPRNMLIPQEFKELDLEKLAKFYADDMGIRMTAIENGMYNKQIVHERWIDPITSELKKAGIEKPESYTDKVETWIAQMQNMRGERKVGINEADKAKLRRETENKAKNDIFITSFGKIATAAFNYGTTMYSMFTPMILGPFIGSWKGIASQYKRGITAPKQYAGELKAFTDNLETMGIIERKFLSFAPEYKQEWRTSLLGDKDNILRNMAEFSDWGVEKSANLSFTRMLGVDPDNLGLGRLFFGNMLDISLAEAGVTTMGVFKHIEDLVDAGKKLDSQNQVKVGRTNYTKETLYQELEELGIQNPENFIKRSDEFKDFNKFMKGNGTDFDPKMYADMGRVAENVINQYHARSKLSRNIKWLDNVWGRSLSRYSVYAQNFGVQTTSKRIYQPIRDWSRRYDMKDPSVPMFKLAWGASTGNDKIFKEAFGEDMWEQAYNEFPVRAVNNFFKVFGALAVGKAMMITRGGMLDMTGIVTNEAVGNDDYEAWRNVNKQMVLGVDAETGEEFTFGDIFSGDVQGFDLVKMFTSTLAGAAQLGFGGRYAQLPENLRFAEGGISDLTPVTGFANDTVKRAGKIITSPWADMPRTAAKEVVDFSLLRFTPFGTFYDMRTGLINGMFQKPKNRNIQFRDGSTGIDMDASMVDF